MRFSIVGFADWLWWHPITNIILIILFSVAGVVLSVFQNPLCFVAYIFTLVFVIIFVVGHTYA